jgi:hypothetical protein
MSEELNVKFVSDAGMLMQLAIFSVFEIVVFIIPG